MAAPRQVLSPDELALLARLELDHRQRARGMHPGQRRSDRTARSPELADFRPYAVGDDVRQIDWRAFARLERLMLRLYVAEEEAALNVVVDTSASMGLGSPAKWPAVRRLTAALAMLGLSAMDRVAIGVLRRGGPHTPHVRLPGGTQRLLGFVSSLETGGAAGPEQLAGLRWMRPGVTVVVSDFMVEGSWRPALAALGQRHQEPLLWQVVAPDEEHPRLSGDVRLRDVGSGSLRELTVTARVVADYRKAFAAHRDSLQQAATSAGGRFLHSSSGDDLESTLRTGLQAGALRRV